ncbi:carbohydrate kinase family protein [Exilibacterium tricleocarpae]|nr:carbohydrate kinase family protein [Exilibacterium tricleocarpae]
MKSAVVTGYASLDYPVILDGQLQGDHTVMIKSRPEDNFPRPGGSPRYVGRSLAQTGVKTSIVTWIGSDEMGKLFCRSIKGDGIRETGVAVVKPGSTPICLMLYQQDGSCGCCFDPGFMGREALTVAQSELIRKADLLCITVGPAQIGLRALSLARAETAIAWVAKNDPLSYSEDLREALGQRADYIFCNLHERGWIDDAIKSRAKPPPLVIETRGAGDVLVCQGEERHSLNVTHLAVKDTCGAGDTLAGACLAAIMNGEKSLAAIGRAGIDAVQAMLGQRVETD